MKSLRVLGALGETLLKMVESRFELFALEFKLERARIAAVLVLVVIGAGSLLLAGVAFTTGLVWAVSPDYRLLVLAVCMVVYLLIAAVCLFWATRFFRKNELPFNETRQELNRDVACLISAIKNKK